jgi:hypothetical protein
VNIRVEFLPGRVKLDDPVPAQGLQQLRPRHLHPREERCEGGVLRRDGLGYVFQRGGEDVDGREEVLGKLLDGVFPCGDFLLVGPFLEVDKVGFAVGQCGLRATSQTRTGFLLCQFIFIFRHRQLVSDQTTQARKDAPSTP